MATNLLPSVWDTPGNVDTLVSMWTEGASASEVARALGQGVTRNSVIGKATRLGLTGRSKVSTTAQSAKARRPDQHGNKGQPRAASIVARAESRQRSAALAVAQHARRTPFREGTLPVEDDAGVDCTHLVGIMDLTAHTCRWPVGDPLLPGFGFCGAEPIEGQSYCAEHHRKAHTHLGSAAE